MRDDVFSDRLDSGEALGLVLGPAHLSTALPLLSQLLDPFSLSIRFPLHLVPHCLARLGLLHLGRLPQRKVPIDELFLECVPLRYRLFMMLKHLDSVLHLSHLPQLSPLDPYLLLGDVLHLARLEHLDAFICEARALVETLAECRDLP